MSTITLDSANTQLIIQLLNHMKTQDIVNRISTFKSLTPSITPIEELRKNFAAALPVFLVLHGDIMTSRKEFYRIRKHAEFILTKYDDFWCPPQKDISVGRLNVQNQQILYLSLDPITPFHEANIEPGDYFTFMYYKYKTEAKISALFLEGLPDESELILRKNGINDKGFLNYTILCDFLKGEMIKPVGKGTEYIYIVTNLIKEYLDPSQTEQGYLYSSVKDFARRNLAVKQNIAKSLLDCTGSIHGRFIEYRDNGTKVTMSIFGRCSQIITPDEKIKCEEVFWRNFSFSMSEADKMGGGFVIAG